MDISEYLVFLVETAMNWCLKDLVSHVSIMLCTKTKTMRLEKVSMVLRSYSPVKGMQKKTEPYLASSSRL